MKEPYFLGIDIGTQGARVVLLDVSGHVVGSQEEAFALNEKSREEQSPQEWWAATERSVKALLKEAAGQIALTDIKAISVTSTSGTVIPLDAANNPLYPAIMYSDNRSAEQGRLCKQAAQKYHPQGYTGFNASSGLSKMVWFGQQYPDKAQRLRKWIHATDYIIGKLSENWGITDYTNALKSGYDVNEGFWPAYIYEQLPLKKEWLPEVVPSGTPIGHLAPALAADWGLNSQVQIVAGMTDGCASQIASGAVNLGDWNTTIGTTLVVKGVTRTEIKDPEDRLYSHRHPEGFWMPGGASNTGADWITQEFKADLDELNEQAAQLIPSGYIAYPLRQEGERFPFISPQARGFEPEGLTPAQRFVANLEGVAYIERYAFVLIEQLSGEKVKAVYTAGGASNSDTWLTIRSNVLNRPIYKMRHVTGAVGAAILAASKTHFNSIIEATQALTHIEKEFRPNPALSTSYEAGYQEFIRTLQEKGYIQKDYQYA
ncbi:carbohydrate kinase [Adhaeribacter aerolatus]|uniref:Carbohydrate kinase n=1 Tax=Adhaeribacter aerolatus TaxID=670289 RepID=A0A512AV45_9BACT|nr:FGGY-family carbohydrate kinase [Adhaeribacter aerolatus]GEO03560.1 carbohydrate kinase [Adhaeribacter aerolatus]